MTTLNIPVPLLRPLAKLVLLGTIGTSSLEAQQPRSEELVSDRPDATESPLAVPTGTWQIEVGASWEETGESKSLQAPGSLLRYGISERLELRLGWDGWNQDRPASGPDVDGTGDGEIGFKLELPSPFGQASQLALLAATSIPIGTGSFSTGRLDPGFLVSVAHDLADGIGLGWNAGIAWTSEEQGDDHHTDTAARYTLSLGFDLSARHGAFLEVFGEESFNDGLGQTTIDGGVTWLVAPLVQLDVAAGFGVRGPVPDRFVTAGIVIRFPH